uniref:Uncharacterized protein n=1 Tax=Oryza brachyantha TaxID=4533 RepID=J3LT69_ORYBR
MAAMTRVNVARDKPARSSNHVAPAPALFLRRGRSAPPPAASVTGQPKRAVGVDAAALAAMASTQRDTRPRLSARGRRLSHDLRARMASLGFLRTVWEMNLSAGDEVVVGVVVGHAEALRGAAQRSGGGGGGVELDAVAELGRLLERLRAAGEPGGGCGARRTPRPPPAPPPPP